MMSPERRRKSETSGAYQEYLEAVAPEAVELHEDFLLFPNTLCLPLTLRAQGLPGMPARPWSRVQAGDLVPAVPSVYSLALQREAPDVLRGALRVRRTIFESVLAVLSEKTGRRPSRLEMAADAGLDEAESRVAMGEPAFKVALILGLYASRGREPEIASARKALEARMRGRGFHTQRLMYIPERSLLHFQPGGILFPGVQEPVLMADEVINLLPVPSRPIMPPEGAVWLGSAVHDGRDVFFSPGRGIDPDLPSPAHATTLVLGEMGSGKTSLMRSIMLQRLLQGRMVISLDPEGENTRLCRASGGTVIPAGLPDDADTCLFHPLEAGSAGELLFAVRFLIAALNAGKAIDNVTQAAMHDIVQRYWAGRPGSRMPLSHLVKELGVVPGDHEQVRALLHPFAAGGLWDGFFDRPEALMDSRVFSRTPDASMTPWWNFDLSGLREENKSIVHALLAWFIYRIVSLTEAPLDVYLDEGWRLLRSSTFAGLLDELGRRARKRGIGIMLATHLPEDLSNRPSSLGLASLAFAGRMSPGQAEDFLHSLGTPPDLVEIHAPGIAALPRHAFYAIPAGGQGGLFSFRVRLPPSWLEVWGKYGAAR